MSTAASGDERLVELLIRHGAGVNQRDNDGDTALRYAAGYGHMYNAFRATALRGTQPPGTGRPLEREQAWPRRPRI